MEESEGDARIQCVAAKPFGAAGSAFQGAQEEIGVVNLSSTQSAPDATNTWWG